MKKRLNFVIISVLSLTVIVFLYKLRVNPEYTNVYNFESLKLLLNNSNLTEICINTIPPFKRNESKYIYIKDGMAYTFKKNFWGIQSYGNELDKKFEKIMINKFSEDLKIINSQGIAGICLPIDGMIKINIPNFDVSQIISLDSIKNFDNYKYICFTKRDIRLSYIKHEYSSILYNKNEWYFYYSNL